MGKAAVMAWIIVYSIHPKIRRVKANLNDRSLLIERTKRDHIRLKIPNIEILEKKLTTNCLVPDNRISTSVRLRTSFISLQRFILIYYILISHASRLQQLSNRQTGLASRIIIQVGVLFCFGGRVLMIGVFADSNYQAIIFSTCRIA